MARSARWWLSPGRVASGLLDALARWVRMPPDPSAGARRFVVLQICGCSHEVLREAVVRRRLPALARLLREGTLDLHRIPSGLPTSTPAFQAGLMYGGPVDVPAFEFLDKRAGAYRWFPRPWDAAAVEAAHARPGQGIVRGGRTYGCVFGGGADDTVLTFAHLLRPYAFWGWVGFRAWVVPGLILAWLVAQMSVVTLWELLCWLGGALRNFNLGRRVASLRQVGTQILVGGWLRELFTLGVTADLYAGVPALYVNFVETSTRSSSATTPGRPGHPARTRRQRPLMGEPAGLRIATYNIHRGRGLDGRERLDRIAAVLAEVGADLAEVGADVVALQEVFRVQAWALAEAMGMAVAFGPTRRLPQDLYGNVCLTRLPLVAHRRYNLTCRPFEPRGCLRADVDVGHGELLHVLNVHLGLGYRERIRQVRMLAGMAGRAVLPGPRVVLGDFNEWFNGRASHLLREEFGHPNGRGRRLATHPSPMPVFPLDRIYHDPVVRIVRGGIHRSRLAWVASDHLPAYADLVLRRDRVHAVHA